MKQSEKLTSLIPSLIALQSELAPIAKNVEGGRGKYANLQAIMEQIRPLLQKHKFSIVQIPTNSSAGAASLSTVLLHESGEYISGDISVPSAKLNDPQAFGSAMTYGRRYAIMALLGITTTDDDGESAVITLEDYMKQIFSANSVTELGKVYNEITKKVDRQSIEKRAINIVVEKYKEELIKLDKKYDGDDCPI